jgi:hypothetical protein
MAANILLVQEHQMMQLGLEACGFPMKSDNLNKKRFRDLYGLDAKGSSVLFQDLQAIDLGLAKINKISPNHFLMTMYWIRGYGVHTRVMAVFGVKCPKTFWKKIWMYLYAIQALKSIKVSLLF